MTSTQVVRARQDRKGTGWLVDGTSGHFDNMGGVCAWANYNYPGWPVEFWRAGELASVWPDDHDLPEETPCSFR